MLHDPKWDQKVEPELDEVSQHLLRVADYIEKHGWCQRQTEDEKGQVCMFGALCRTNNRDLILLSNTTLRINDILPHTTIPIWNDQIQQTKEQVINKLREVAYLNK